MLSIHVPMHTLFTAFSHYEPDALVEPLKKTFLYVYTGHKSTTHVYTTCTTVTHIHRDISSKTKKYLQFFPSSNE